MRRPLRALLLALPALGLLNPALAADMPAPSLRIVSAGLPDAEAYRRNIEVAQEACQLTLKLPRSKTGLPSEATLAAFRVQETEQLLDGPMAALYETMNEIMPDPGQGCRLRVAHRFSVHIDKTCSWRLYGHSGLIGTDGPGTPAPLREEPGAVPDCQPLAKVRPATVAAEAKAPRQDAGLGQQCVWDSHVLELLRGSAPTGPGEGGCLLAGMPTYPYSSYQGQRRRVSLMHHLDDTTRGGTRFSKAIGAAAGVVDARMTAFEKGIRIPADRFTRKGAETFLSQPRWTEL